MGIVVSAGAMGSKDTVVTIGSTEEGVAHRPGN